jgi:hypothetical protein
MMPRSRTLYSFLTEEWEAFKTVCNRRWSHLEDDLLENTFSRRQLLGSGYFGIVISTQNKKLVVKITSDRDEGYFNQLILNDPYLQGNIGLPLVLDCFHIPEWGAHVILRENVLFGVNKLPESSPLSRAIPILDKYGEQSIRIENKIANMLSSLRDVTDKLSKSDFTHAYREAQGLMRTEIIKALKTLPYTSESSKYYYAMDVLRHSLDKYGIALWDLHNLNLGYHQYDMSEFSENAPELDTSSILILDVGGNFGSPIMSQMIEDEEV